MMQLLLATKKGAGLSSNGLLTGLLAYRKLDGNSNDSHSTYNGTDTSMSYATGKINNAGSFNGTTSVIQTPSITNSTGSVSYRMYHTSISDGPTAICSNQNSNGSNNYRIFLTEPDGRLSFLGGYDTVIRTTTSTITTGTWYHVVWTQDGSQIKVYLNGVLKTLTTNTTPTAWLNVTSANQLCIGALKRGTQIYNRTNGLIDEVGIWSTVLTTTQITDLYNAGSGLAYGSFTS